MCIRIIAILVYTMKLKLVGLFLQRSIRLHWSWSEMYQIQLLTPLKKQCFIMHSFAFIPIDDSFTLKVSKMHFVFFSPFICRFFAIFLFGAVKRQSVHILQTFRVKESLLSIKAKLLIKENCFEVVSVFQFDVPYFL